MLGVLYVREGKHVRFFDVREPEHPSEIGSWPLELRTRWAEDCTVADVRLYLAAGDAGVLALDAVRWAG